MVTEITKYNSQNRRSHGVRGVVRCDIGVSEQLLGNISTSVVTSDSSVTSGTDVEDPEVRLSS